MVGRGAVGVGPSAVGTGVGRGAVGVGWAASGVLWGRGWGGGAVEGGKKSSPPWAATSSLSQSPRLSKGQVTAPRCRAVLERLEPRLQGNWQLLVTNLLDRQSRQVYPFDFQGLRWCSCLCRATHFPPGGRAWAGAEHLSGALRWASPPARPGRTVCGGGVGKLVPSAGAVPWALAWAQISVDRWMQE